jgi:TPR repeat protein
MALLIGEGVSSMPIEANKAIKKAAEYGNADEMLMLGLNLANSYGIQKSWKSHAAGSKRPQQREISPAADQCHTSRQLHKARGG